MMAASQGPHAPRKRGRHGGGPTKRLATVGYGDLTPTTDYSRIFTIIYIFIGLGVLVLFLSAIAQQYMRQKAGTPAVRESIWAP